MSEYINNASRRKEILKKVITHLHEGKTVAEVKEEFGEVARTASSAEIAQVEQMLIQEGLPVEDIQRLCDVHVSVFKESLDDQRAPETIPGHPLHTFITENRLLTRLLTSMEDVLSSDKDAIPWIKDSSGYMEQLLKLEKHYLRKENLLFPYLEKYGFSGPSRVMWGKHDEVRSKIRKLQSMLKENAPSEAIRALFAETDKDMREMIYKEEKILFPASLEHLNEEDWVAIRNQEKEFGYFLVNPGNEWNPPRRPGAEAVVVPTYSRPDSVAMVEPESIPTQAGEIPLRTGSLTLKQITLMLTHLPVDITYVDENDEVRFYSQTRERIFDRTPSIIGRKVQNCHPPQSIAKVQHILDDFRAGKRDVAEFWIRMMGKFIHIRYFAVRDDDGKYCGTIEVTQEIDAIQALQGEKRLLDD